MDLVKMPNDCLEIPISRDRWEKTPSPDQTWMMFEMLQAIDQRVRALEAKKTFDERMLTLGSIGGGIIGGLATLLGIKIS